MPVREKATTGPGSRASRPFSRPRPYATRRETAGLSAYSRGIHCRERLAAGGGRIRTRGPTAYGRALRKRVPRQHRRVGPDLFNGSAYRADVSDRLRPPEPFARSGTRSSNPLPSSGESRTNPCSCSPDQRSWRLPSSFPAESSRSCMVKAGAIPIWSAYSRRSRTSIPWNVLAQVSASVITPAGAVEVVVRSNGYSLDRF